MCADALSLSRLIVHVSHGVVWKKWKPTEAPGDPYPILAGDCKNYIPNMAYEAPTHISHFPCTNPCAITHAWFLGSAESSALFGKTSLCPSQLPLHFMTVSLITFFY